MVHEYFDSRFIVLICIMGFIQYTTQNAQTENVRVYPPQELHDFEVTVKENECSRVYVELGGHCAMAPKRAAQMRSREIG